MARSNSNSNSATSSAFSEVNSNPPKIVGQTLAKYGPDRARKQKIAIALSKARKAGANLPSPNLKKNSKSF